MHERIGPASGCSARLLDAACHLVSFADLAIKPNINKQTATYVAQQAISKKIVKRIEQTMAARAGTDGAGLSIVKQDDTDGAPRPLLKAPVLSQGKQKKAKR